MKDGVNKLCKHCNQVLPLDRFGINRATKDGLAYKCLDCMRVLEERKRRLKGIKKFVPIEIIDGLKECTLCKAWKPLSEYNKSSKHRLGLQTHCRPCSNFKAKEYDKCPRQRRNRKLKTNYGIDNNQYENMLREQGECCAICGTKETRNKSTTFFAVDHCHKTGKVRGLLCDYCNVGLGRFEDDVERLQNAIKYLSTFYTK